MCVGVRACIIDKIDTIKSKDTLGTSRRHEFLMIS